MILLLLVSFLFGSVSYSQDSQSNAEKVLQKPCSLDSAAFKEVMSAVQEDYDLTLSDKRIKSTARVAARYDDYTFTTRSQYTDIHKSVVYIGGALYRSAAKSTIPYDTSIEKINYIMACTVYLSGTQWVILDAIRISPPTRPTGVYSSFSETREITVEPPTAPTDTQQYSILIYEKSSLEVKGMPDGYSMHAQPEYPSLNPWYNFRTSFTVP